MKVITIGRGSDNDAVIDDITVSSHHLQIIKHDDGHYTLSDFGSTNGTYVNGQKIGGEIVLDESDIVRIGNTTIPWRMYFEESEQQKPQPPQQDNSRQTQQLKKKRNVKIWVWIIIAVIALISIIAIVLFVFNSNNQINNDLNDGPVYTDVQSLFVSGKDIYAAGSTCSGASLSNDPTLWINGIPQSIGNMGDNNAAKSVFVSGNDIYVAVTEDNKGALLWMNGECQLLGTVGSKANSVYVFGNDVYVAGQKDGQPTLWKNGISNSLGESGSAESVVVKDDKVYVAGYTDNSFTSNAFLYISGNSGDMTFDLEMEKANSIFITNDGEIYIAGVRNNKAALWVNGEFRNLENLEKSSAQSVAVNRVGSFVVTGISQNPKSRAAVWVNGNSVDVDDIFGYQAMSVVTDGSSFYLGGCSKDGIWSVWKYDGVSEFDVNTLERVNVQ